LIKITGRDPGAGRKKIRGGAFAYGLAVRIFLIFWFFSIKLKIPTCRGKKNRKTNGTLNKTKTEVQIGTDPGLNWK
jgi:hypothetical protein